MRDTECRDVVDSELRKVFILIRRTLRYLHQRRKICSNCYNKFLAMILELELVLEEHEYEEALRRWRIKLSGIDEHDTHTEFHISRNIFSTSRTSSPSKIVIVS